MRTIDLTDEKIEQSIELAEILGSFRTSPPVVFAGSAISLWEPSGLITGMSVTKALWEILFEDLPLTDEEQSFIDSLVNEFPFEHLFELCPNKKAARDFLIRLYDCSAANPVHRALAQGFTDGRVAHLVTTNYDRCIEAALSQFDGLAFETVVNEASAIEASHDSSGKYYFKVHGTADSRADGLVFTLRDEGLLPRGKRDLLGKVFLGAACVFIGYSGLDFELCPSISKIDTKSVVWIDLGSRPLSMNARNLLEHSNGVFVKTDLRDFVEHWLGLDAKAVHGSGSIDRDRVKAVFSDEEISLWKIAVLNNLGLATLARKALSEASSLIPVSERMSHEARALACEGHYRSAAKTFTSLCTLHASRQDKEACSNSWLDASDAYRGGGYYVRSVISLLRGRFASERFDRAKYYLKKSLLLQNLVLLTEVINPAGRLKSLSILWLRRNLVTCARLALDQGSLHDFQQVGFLAERHGIDMDELMDGEYYAPPQAYEGYRHLGYYHAEAMAFNDWCSKREFTDLSTEEVSRISDDFRRYIAYCELTHQNAILWKLIANKRKFLIETGVDEFTERAKLACLFNKCEYSAIQRWSFSRRYRLEDLLS